MRLLALMVLLASCSVHSDSPLRRGQKVRVTRLEGLTLVVEPINKEQ